MIITENYQINGKNFTKYYSDNDVYIRQNETGNEYSEANDVEGVNYTYTETDRPIETDSDQGSEIEQKARAYDIIVGGENNESD